MPNWTDDEGNCHFEVAGTPCYKSKRRCPIHDEMSNKNTRTWQYCEECGIWGLCNDEATCIDCEQEATEDED